MPSPLEEQVEKLARLLEKAVGYIESEFAYPGWETKFGEPNPTAQFVAECYTAIEAAALLPLEVTDESPLRVTVDTADLIELLYGATTDSPANRKARTRLRAALTQPQTEQWHENDEADKAATAAGVADADLEAAAMEISVKATRLDPETYKVPDKLIWMLRSALFPNEDMERIKSPGPYAKAFRERVCPVPDWPTILGEKEESDAT